MRTPYAWLESYCRSGLSPTALADRLTMTGTKVEALDHVGVPDATEFVVGRVLSAERHPDADRLTVCEVDDGAGTRTIVCGAPNVAPGQTVAVAKPGARPDLQYDSSQANGALIGTAPRSAGRCRRTGAGP